MDGDAIIGRIYVQATIMYFHERVHRHVSTSNERVRTGSKDFQGFSTRVRIQPKKLRHKFARVTTVSSSKRLQRTAFSLGSLATFYENQSAQRER